MENPLRHVGNVPVTASALESLYPHLKGRNRKLLALEKQGDIVRIKKGLYVVSPQVTGKVLSTELIANRLYSPSYVSMSSALRFYGLIPEAVYTTQSMTVKASRSFDTPLGRFEFTSISHRAFSVGITRETTESDYAFLIATPEKALCDLIAHSPGVNLRYRHEAQTYLEEDIRLDMEAFGSFDTQILEAYAAAGKKSNSIRTLIRLLKQQ